MLIDEPNKFEYTQNSRGIYSSFAILFTLFISIGFILTGQIIFMVLGFLLFFFLGRGLISIIRNYQWNTKVENNVVFWNYPKWPKSQGSIDLITIREISIDDAGGYLEFTDHGGDVKKQKIIAPMRRLYLHLQKSNPEIKLEFFEGS